MPVRGRPDSGFGVAVGVSRNTGRTVWGYLVSLAHKYTGHRWVSARELRDIYNYRRIDERISTSGQPTVAQFDSIRDAGFTSVVNLAPAGAENALPDEAGVLRGLGLHYVHLPVDFARPTQADFRGFVEALGALESEKVWIHCAANMRVSAFVFRYRTEILDQDPGPARADLEAIWEPFGAWKPFLAGQPDA